MLFKHPCNSQAEEETIFNIIYNVLNIDEIYHSNEPQTLKPLVLIGYLDPNTQSLNHLHNYFAFP